MTPAMEQLKERVTPLLNALFGLASPEQDLTEAPGYEAHVITCDSLHRLVRDRVPNEGSAIL